MIIKTTPSENLHEALKLEPMEKNFIVATVGKLIMKDDNPRMMDVIATAVEKLAEVPQFNLATPNVIVYVSVITFRVFTNPMVRLGFVEAVCEAEMALETMGYKLAD
jgi:hypothetical protein